MFIFKQLGALLGFVIKKLFKRPAIILYRQLLKAQFRLTALGIEIKNPFVYALSSKTLGYVLLLLLSAFVITGNIVSHEQDLDFFQPRSIIARLVVSEEDQIFMEEFDTSPSSSSQPDYGSFAGVKAPTPSGEDGEDTLTGEPGDVALGPSALIKPVIPSAAEEPTTTVATPETPRTYTVQEGESLGLIARKFGLKTSTILWANGLSEKSTIKPGQTLVILPTDGVLYNVRRGDSLSKIAQQYDTDINRIVSYNKLTGPTDIRIGEQIIIPGGTPPTGSQIAKPTPTTPTKRPTIKQPVPAVIAKSPGMVWPTSATRITQYFGWRHTGIDVAGPIGNKIYAATSGTVTIAQYQSNGYGNTILINHGNGMTTRYGHASKLLVKKGDYVTKGEVIAIVGSTGRSTGPHLHFEVLINGKRVNPLSYVRK